MPLLSTNIRDIHLNSLISKGFNRFTVFLDDDNLTVKKQTLKIKKTLNKLGPTTVIHSGGIDPKEMSDEQLKEILK